MSKVIQTMVFAAAVLLLAPQHSDAKTKNPPGCKNSSPTAHNPNCSGGSGTHVPSTPDKPPVEINTITHGNSGSGAVAMPSVVPSGGGAGSAAGSAPLSSIPSAKPSGTISRAPASASTNSVQPSGAGGNGSSGGVVIIAPSNGASGAPANNATNAVTGTSVAPTNTSSAASADRSHGHGEVLEGHDPNIVPVNPLHAPAVVPHLRPATNRASTFSGNRPSRIEQIAPTDIAAGQYGEPVSGFGHASGNSFGQTGELGYKFVHVQELDGYPRYDSHIPPKPGKNFVPGYRAVLVSRDGVSTCAISGMGRRTIVNQNGHTISIGHAETLHFRSSSTAHLPSNHQMASHCLVSIKK
ncbi:hypothetical protein HED22_03360 [Thalassospira sp. HF15]|uniref:hypothetical protein n=1 Tax=Thalassospira sp. HF15 TaxID=2722755 RepID=UPI00143026A8|nr:hypothetical protein [Thalassospira sp. HF15]NIY74671.1 hypothetical protein [Thalassospira sp. HF15]